MKRAEKDLVATQLHLVRSVVYGVTHRLDPELVSTGYLALVLAAASYDGRGTLAGYARQKILWAVLDRLRRDDLRAHDAIAEEPAAADVNLALKLDIQRAIEDLPPRQRLILHLRFWRGLEIEEAARAAGCSRTTAVSDYRAARATLRERLGAS